MYGIHPNEKKLMSARDADKPVDELERRTLLPAAAGRTGAALLDFGSL